MEKALEKRPVSTEAIDEAMGRILHKIRSLGEREIAARAVGELVMEELRHLDEVAFVRFASVYRHFQDIDAFRDEIDKLRQHPRRRKPGRDKDVDREQLPLLPAETQSRQPKKADEWACTRLPAERHRPATQVSFHPDDELLRLRPPRHGAGAGARGARLGDHAAEPARGLRHREGRPDHR